MLALRTTESSPHPAPPGAEGPARGHPLHRRGKGGGCLKTSLTAVLLLLAAPCFCWGFYAHRKINYQAVFLLPPQMMTLYKRHIGFLSEHAVDPDKRRYAIAAEAPRHFIDMDHYGVYPFDSLPRRWTDAVARYSEDTLQRHGIAPWWLLMVQRRLTNAFKEKDEARILKLSAEIGHYLADIHVPLHACSNHNGQHTDQRGIHGFWESRIPELMAEREWDFFIGRAAYIPDPAGFIWKRVLESAAAADTVLRAEKELTAVFPSDKKYAFEDRNGLVVRQYSTAFCRAYNEKLNGMTERRMRQSIAAVASFWFTAWVDAGQPDLSRLPEKELSPEAIKEYEELNEAWKGKTEAIDCE